MYRCKNIQTNICTYQHLYIPTELPALARRPLSSDLELRYRVLLITDRAAMHGLHPHEGACCFGCQFRTSKYAVSLPAEYPSP